MSWLTDEKGDSRPIELYTFTSPTAITRLTSYRTDYSFGGNSYTAVAGSRSSLTSQDATSSNDDFSIEIPATHALVRSYAQGVPPRELYLEVVRVQQTSGVGMRVAEGYVSGPAFKGRMASFRVPGLSDLLASPVPSVSASRVCQHILYDDRCTVARASFQVATTVSTVSADRKTITIAASMSGHPDEWAQHGEVLFTVTTERRTIVSQVGSTIVLKYPIPTAIAPGAACTVFAGCDHTVFTCANKFTNVANFGGLPYLPIVNIFYVDARSIGQ